MTRAETSPAENAGHDGPAFYDNNTVFANYAALRAKAHNANDTLDRPVMLRLLGDVRGLDVLYFGCGDVACGRLLLDAGAAGYIGVDGLANMIEAAQRNLAGTRGEAVQGDLRDWSFPAERFDRATSRLALHYLPDLGPTLAGVHRSLRAGGRFLFSVEHPVITSSDNNTGDKGAAQWMVSDYFLTGRRLTSWLGAEVVKYHRTIEDHFTALREAGFTVTGIHESRPERANFTDDGATSSVGSASVPAPRSPAARS